MIKNFQVGDIVKVIGNSTDHNFPLGEVVRIKKLDITGAVDEAEYLDGSDYWFMADCDLEKVEEVQNAK